MEKNTDIHGRAENMMEIRGHSMDLSSKWTNVQSLDSNGMVIDVSPGWLRLTGYNKEDVIGHSFREVLVEDSLGKVKNEFPHLRDYGFVNNVPLHIRRKDGGIIEATLNGTSKYDKDGNFERTFCELKSIDQYVNSADGVSAILATEKFLRMIINLKSNITLLYQHIMDESYTSERLFKDLLDVLSEPAEFDQVMIGTLQQAEGHEEIAKVWDYFDRYQTLYPYKELLVVKAQEYYGRKSPEDDNKSVAILSVNVRHPSEKTLVFIEFDHSNVSNQEWLGTFDELKLQIDPLVVLVNALKQMREVDESLKDLM